MINERLLTTIADRTAGPVFMTAIKERFLKLPLPMAVMIGNPQGLDVVSKNVLVNILTDEHCGAIGQILWVICEKTGNDAGNAVMPSVKREIPPQGRIDHRYVFVGRLPYGKKPASDRFPLAA